MDTSDNFIPSHIHASYFRARMFLSLGHLSRRPLMRLLMNRTERMGTWCWPEGWTISETMYMTSCQWCGAVRD